MRFKISLLQHFSVVTLAMALGLAGVPAEATPLPPANTLGIGSVGESDLTSNLDQTLGEDITIDWMVVDAAPFGFAGEFA